MRKLFDQGALGSLTVRNRVVRSATWEGMADEHGASTAVLNGIMADAARNGIGLIITGHCYVAPEGQAGPRQMGAHEDAVIPSLRCMAEGVQKEGGAIVLQLAHGGVNAMDSSRAVGPSSITTPAGKSCRAMTREEIHQTTRAFAAAALRAREAGFDGVQIHAGHGYLLSEFLSPYYNARDDEYGGPLENRARFLLEVYEAVREAVGEGYPVLAKLNSEDFLENGFQQHEMVAVSAMLQQKGIAAIELSGGTIYEPGQYGTIRQGKRPQEGESYYRVAARAYKESVSTPLIVVGGIRSFEVAEEMVTEGEADFISFSRPFIREPALVKRWLSGDLSASTCISCNSCFGPILSEKGFYCPIEQPAA